MSTKERIATILEERTGEYQSGQEIADLLGVTRTAVWKGIRQLESEGYEIEALPRRGYRLSARNDALNAWGIRRELGAERSLFTIEVRDSVTSTNNVLKEQADGLPDWYVLAAVRQTAGKGRVGRTFYSPADTGIYLSVLLRPELPATESARITTAAAVAACRAIEQCTEAKPAIKWINDVYVNGKKVCGILTEGSLNLETGGLEKAVMGIGFNVYEPAEGFPEAIREIAGAISPNRRGGLRNRLAAGFLREFRSLCADLEGANFAEEYRRRSFLPGQEVLVIRGAETRPALALDLDEECRLRVRYENGEEETLSSGEVSVRKR